MPSVWPPPLPAWTSSGECELEGPLMIEALSQYTCLLSRAYVSNSFDRSASEDPFGDEGRPTSSSSFRRRRCQDGDDGPQPGLAAAAVAAIRLQLEGFKSEPSHPKVGMCTCLYCCCCEIPCHTSRLIIPLMAATVSQGRITHHNYHHRMTDHTPQLPPPHDRATSQSRSLKHAAVFPMNSLSCIARLVSSELSGRSRTGAG